MKKLIIICFVFFSFLVNAQSYSKLQQEVELILPKLKNSYDGYKKYYNLVNWEKEFEKTEITKDEFTTLSNKIKTLESYYENSVKQQDILMDLLIKTIKENLPEREHKDGIKSFDKFFEQIKLSRTQIQIQIAELRYKLILVKTKS